MLFLLAFTATTVLFAATVIAMLVANVTVAAWRWRDRPGLPRRPALYPEQQEVSTPR
jgi:hypothetical protein